MKIADTISVNPSKTALGHVDTPASNIFRSPVLGVENGHQTFNPAKVVFPSVGAAIADFKKYAVPLRTLFATILIVSGLVAVTSPLAIHSMGFAVCCLSFGGVLALGLFTRPVMLGAAVFYCVNGALAIRAGVPDISVFSLMFGCLIFCLTGAGKYSCDSLIRAFLSKRRKYSSKKHKEEMMGYKAFHKLRM